MNPPTPATDTADLREIRAALQRGRLWIAGGALFGLLLGAVALWAITPQYRASSTVLIRLSSGAESSALASLSRTMGAMGDILALPSSSGLDTEVELLTSRQAIGHAVDSLALQVKVEHPEGVAPRALFSQARLEADVAAGPYRFERQEDGSYTLRGHASSGPIRPGQRVPVPGGELTLAAHDDLPSSFSVRLLHREDAITAVKRSLSSSSRADEVVELAYRARSPELAAEVPNVLIAQYLQRRRTIDRGVNQHRYEFLREHTDSIFAQLAEAEALLRLYQEDTGVMDPELVGRVGLEQLMELRSEAEQINREIRALESIISRETRELSAHELASFPTFLRNAAINDLLRQILALEGERVAELQRRPETDAAVVSLTRQIEHLGARLVQVSRDYRDGLRLQQRELAAEIGRYESDLGTLPGRAEESYRRQREVERLSRTLVTLQTQLVETRLAAMGEGGDVRQIDPATPPRRPAFPNTILTLIGGLLGGLFFGTVGAVGAAQLRREIREPWEAELATGLPAVAYDPSGPLAVGDLTQSRSVLLTPVGPVRNATAIGERIARTATLRGGQVLLANLAGAGKAGERRELTAGGENGRENGRPATTTDSEGLTVYRAATHGSNPAALRSALAEFEARYSLVVSLTPALKSPETVSVLSADRPIVLMLQAGSVTRRELQETVGIASSLGIRVLGTVVDGGRPAADGTRDDLD